MPSLCCSHETIQEKHIYLFFISCYFLKNMYIRSSPPKNCSRKKQNNQVHQFIRHFQWFYYYCYYYFRLIPWFMIICVYLYSFLFCAHHPPAFFSFSVLLFPKFYCFHFRWRKRVYWFWVHCFPVSTINFDFMFFLVFITFISLFSSSPFSFSFFFHLLKLSLFFSIFIQFYFIFFFSLCLLLSPPRKWRKNTSWRGKDFLKGKRGHTNFMIQRIWQSRKR